MVLSAHSPSQNGNATFGDTSLERDRREFARCHYPKHVNQAHKAWVADQVYPVARAGHGGGGLPGPVFGSEPRSSAGSKKKWRRPARPPPNPSGGAATNTNKPS